MVTAVPESRRAGSRADYLFLEGVPWDVYLGLLRAADASRRLQITYDRGRLEIMSPREDHECWSELIGQLVRAAAEELGYELAATGRTTFKEKRLEKGFEPDTCFYLGRPGDGRDYGSMNLSKAFPPDLGVEVDVTSRSIAREPIYAAFGLREVWRFDGQRLDIRELRGGDYRSIEGSQVLPGLTRTDLECFIRMMPGATEATIVRRFRQFLREQPR